MRIGNLILYLAILGGATLPRAVAALTDAVLIEQGKLVGSGGRGAEVRVYKGIPFAARPWRVCVGSLRSPPITGREFAGLPSSVTPARSRPIPQTDSLPGPLFPSARTACT